jgi:hypothetical protein
MTKQATVDAWGADCPEVDPDVEHCQFCEQPLESERKPFHLQDCDEAPSEPTYE